MTTCAWMTVNFELLKELFHLPPGSQITDAVSDDEFTVRLLVVHPDLPNADDYMEIKKCKPVFVHHYEPVEFVEWGVIEDA